MEQNEIAQHLQPLNALHALSHGRAHNHMMPSEYRNLAVSFSIDYLNGQLNPYVHLYFPDSNKWEQFEIPDDCFTDLKALFNNTFL